MKVRGIKRMMMAAALAVATAVSGVAGQAQAFTFGDGDLVLAIYGNNTEALINLGSRNTILAPGGAGLSNLDVSGALAAASVGTGTVRYTLFGHDTTAGAAGVVQAATTFAPGAINPNAVGLTVQFAQSIGMAGLGGFVGDTIARADARSFTANLNDTGTGTMAGTWPVAMQGTIGSILNIMEGDIDTNTFTQVGRVLLTAGGLLTVGNPGPSAVPLPAGVVLFGTGLIGLVGIARRSFNRMAA